MSASFLKRMVTYFPDGAQRLWLFYCGLSSGNKSGIWLANGVLFGSIYGTFDRIKREEDTKSDFLEVTEYKLDGKERVREFEKYWNDSAKRSQAQRGYGWTRMYKSVAWDESPFNYLSCRLWEDKPVDDMIFQSKLKKSDILVNADKETGLPPRTQFITVVDDSVVRTIV